MISPKLSPKVVVTVSTTLKSGGHRTPSSHTKLSLWLLVTFYVVCINTKVPMLIMQIIYKETDNCKQNR